MTTKDAEAIAERIRFNNEEIVRKALQNNAAIHDCIEAGCTVDPDGGDPAKTAKSRRPAVASDIISLKDSL